MSDPNMHIFKKESLLGDYARLLIVKIYAYRGAVNWQGALISSFIETTH